MLKRSISRRKVLRLMGLSAAGATLLAACQPEPEAVEEVEEVEEEEEATEEEVAAPAESFEEWKQKYGYEMEPSDCEKDWNTRMPPAPKKYDPPVKMEIEFERLPEYPEGDSPTDHPKYNWIKDNLGIEYTVHWTADRDTEVFQQKRNTDIASGNLADRLGTYGAELADFIANDAVEEIRDIWEATASPLTKEKRLYPDGANWSPVWRGDKLYGIPFQWGGSSNVDMIGWIRKDWLDKVGLSIPETLEDLENVLRTWKEEGICDYGLNASDLMTWNHSLDPIFAAFGHIPTYWRDFGDGTLVYDSLEPAVKETLILLREWYEAGFLHPDFYTYEAWDAVQLMTEEKTGVTFCPHFAAGDMVDLEQAIEGAEIVTFPVPEGPGGRHRQGRRNVGNAVVYRKGLDPKKIEASINELNWQMELHVNGPEQYEAYGDGLFLEGYDWEWTEDCELKPGEYDTNGLNRSIGWNFDYLSYPAVIRDGNAPKLKWLEEDPSDLNKVQRMIIDNPKTIRNLEVYQEVWETRDMNIYNDWYGVPTDRMVRLAPELPDEMETFMEIVTGTLDADAFDDFVEEWRAAGGDQVAEDVNAWYESIKE